MKERIKHFFKLTENNTNVKTEFIAGLTTFMTMSYIIFVEPTVLSSTGMDFGAVMMATCLSSFIATILMGILANYPIALAAAMGHNFYFTFTVCGAAAIGGLGYGWQAALAAVFIAGIIYVLLTFVGIREKLLNFVPAPLKSGIATGIGLFIAFIGLQWAGLIVSAPGTLVKLGDIHSKPVLLAVFGVIVITFLRALKINGAILYGILATIGLGIPMGIITFHGIAAMPPSIEPTFFKLDFVALFSHPAFYEVIIVFLLLNLFDTVGTLIGVTKQAGFIDKEGKLPRGKQALRADAFSAVIGSVLGCSTVTSYIESSAGVTAGGRTGLANMFTGGLFLLAVFFHPLVKSVGEGYVTPDGLTLYPAIAPALIIVGSFMMQHTKDIKWEDPTDAIPAFLAAIAMPFTFSITEGISWGIISYTLLKLFTGKGKEIHWIIYLFAVIFILRYIFLLN
jgi:AGZA family xanthine/uracil permease-like MFS transporter